MKLSTPFFALLASVSSARAGTILWSGFFNASATVSEFDEWSFSDEIGNWQWYIHGSEPTADYLALSSSYKNPADTTDAQGIKITIASAFNEMKCCELTLSTQDGTSFWNGQTMERTEIIPQTSNNLGQGHLYYHFSLMTSSTNPPNPGYEHQIAFFESHFTEIKFGLIDGEAGTTDTHLRWDINSASQWSTTLEAGNWYNFAYDIDFSGGTCGLWASNGSSPLTQIMSSISCSPSTNSEDWHIGVLRLPNGGTDAAPEDWYWSGIFVEEAPITTSIAGPAPGSGGTAPPSSSSSSSGSSVPPSSAPSSTPISTSPTTAAPAGPTQSQWGQCGGTGWTGPTNCASPYSCVAVSPPYYYQCK